MVMQYHFLSPQTAYPIAVHVWQSQIIANNFVALKWHGSCPIVELNFLAELKTGGDK